MIERQKRMFIILLMMFWRWRWLRSPPLMYLSENDSDFSFILLMYLFRQYTHIRRRPLPYFNITVRNRIIEHGGDAEQFVLNDVFGRIVGRPYEFWLVSGETPESFENLRILLCRNTITYMNQSITIHNQLLSTLIWLRQYPACSLLSLTLGISMSTVSRIIHRTWIKLWEICAPIIQWPTQQEWINKRNKWREMPAVVGMIDGTSHEVLVPQSEPQQEFFSGHRRYHCIHTQVIVDNDKNICFVHSGFLGHVNDANTYQQIGPIGPGLPLDFPSDCYLLADSIYPNGYPLITPYREFRNIPRNERRRRRKINALHRKRRVNIEHVIKEINTFRVIGSLYRHSRWYLSCMVELCAGLAKRRADLLNNDLH